MNTANLLKLKSYNIIAMNVSDNIDSNFHKQFSSVSLT